MKEFSYFSGIKTLVQPTKTGTYNEVGETIPIAGVIVSKAKPTFVSLTVDGQTPNPAIIPTIEDADKEGNVSIYTLKLEKS